MKKDALEKQYREITSLYDLAEELAASAGTVPAIDRQALLFHVMPAMLPTVRSLRRTTKSMPRIGHLL